MALVIETDDGGAMAGLVSRPAVCALAPVCIGRTSKRACIGWRYSSCSFLNDSLAPCWADGPEFLALLPHSSGGVADTRSSDQDSVEVFVSDVENATGSSRYRPLAAATNGLIILNVEKA